MENCGVYCVHAIFIEKGNRQILVDGGPNLQPVVIEMSKRMSFWDRAVDMVVLTHPDADHLGGLVEVLKNGSASSTGDGFLTGVDPQVAVISVGMANSYGHPNKDVVARLAQKLGADNIYRTDEQGTIEVITDGERVWVKTDR